MAGHMVGSAGLILQPRRISPPFKSCKIRINADSESVCETAKPKQGSKTSHMRMALAAAKRKPQKQKCVLLLRLALYGSIAMSDATIETSPRRSPNHLMKTQGTERISVKAAADGVAAVSVLFSIA